MIIYKNTESLNNSQVFRPRPSSLRPLSQQKPTSLNHCAPNYHPTLHKSPTQRQLPQNPPENEYYIQSKGMTKEKAKLVASSAKLINGMQGYTAQTLQQVKNSLLFTLEKWTFKFREEIAAQKQQIVRLQEKIKNQSIEIEQKNHLISDLMNRQRRSGVAEVKTDSLQMKRIDDLHVRINMIMEQLQEQKAVIHNKLDWIANGVIRYFGEKFNQSRVTLSNFLVSRTTNLEQVAKGVDFLSNNAVHKIKGMQQRLQKLQLSVKCMQEMGVKQACNTSKETASHNSSTISNNKSNNQNDLFLSDYFFHPPEAQNPSFKMIQDLAKERQKVNQLPIKVYLDTFGRLKYYESRTFIFDRKGNFSTPTEKDLGVLEQKGWITVIYQ